MKRSGMRKREKNWQFLFSFPSLYINKLLLFEYIFLAYLLDLSVAIALFPVIIQIKTLGTSCHQRSQRTLQTHMKI